MELATRVTLQDLPVPGVQWRGWINKADEGACAPKDSPKDLKRVSARSERCRSCMAQRLEHHFTFFFPYD